MAEEYVALTILLLTLVFLPVAVIEMIVALTAQVLIGG